MSDSEKQVTPPPPVPPPPQMARIEDLAAEFETLDRSCKQLLVQRRKLQARIKSLLKSLVRTIPDLDPKLLQAFERELRLAEENALHLEVWLPEYEQIGSTLISESRALHRQLEDVRQRVAELAADQGRAEQLAEALETGRTLLAARLDAQSRELEQLRADRNALEDRVGALAAELAEARAAPPRRDDAVVVALQAELAEARSRYASLAKTHEKDRQAHAREIASLTRQVTQVREQSEAQITELTRECERLTAALVERGRSAAGPRQDRIDLDAMPEPKRPPRPRPAGPVARDVGQGESGPGGQIVLLDDEKTALDSTAEMTAAGYPVTQFVPHAELASHLPRSGIACMAVNLALPQSWAVVRTLCAVAGRSPVPIIAYALAHPSPRGFWFGPVDFILLPITKESLAGVSSGAVPRLKQALIISVEDGVADSVRQQLSRMRVNSTPARDRAQALETLKTIYPHVVFVHPGASSIDAFRAVAAIRGVSLFQRIPIIFLLDEQPQPREESLFSAAARTVLRLGELKPADLTESLAAAFHRYIPRPG